MGQSDVEAGEVEVGEALVQGAEVILLSAVQGAGCAQIEPLAPPASNRSRRRRT